MTDTNPRKSYPLASGVFDYFPDALMEIAFVSYVGNEQHNPGEPLHWAKEKSQDECDAMLRHYKERFEYDTDGTMHAAKMCWRALAFLQKLIDAERKEMSYETYNRWLKEAVKK